MPATPEMRHKNAAHSSASRAEARSLPTLENDGAPISGKSAFFERNLTNFFRAHFLT